MVDEGGGSYSYATPKWFSWYQRTCVYVGRDSCEVLYGGSAKAWAAPVRSRMHLTLGAAEGPPGRGREKWIGGGLQTTTDIGGILVACWSHLRADRPPNAEVQEVHLAQHSKNNPKCQALALLPRAVIGVPYEGRSRTYPPSPLHFSEIRLWTRHPSEHSHNEFDVVVLFHGMNTQWTGRPWTRSMRLGGVCRASRNCIPNMRYLCAHRSLLLPLQ